MEINFVIPLCVSEARLRHCIQALLTSLRDLIRQRRERQLAPPQFLLTILHPRRIGNRVMVAVHTGKLVTRKKA